MTIIPTSGLMVISLCSHFDPSDTPWFMPSMGAAAVLFAFDQKATVKVFLMMNFIAGLVGIGFGTLCDAPEIAATLSLATILIVMVATGSIHPPAGATAMLTGLVPATDNSEYILVPLVPNLLVMAVAFAILRAVQKFQEARRSEFGLLGKR